MTINNEDTAYSTSCQIQTQAANLSDHDKKINEFGKNDASHIGKLLRHKDLATRFHYKIKCT